MFLFCSGFEKDPATSKFEIEASIRQISLVGKYKVRGNILLLPIVGSGAANLTFGKFSNLHLKKCACSKKKVSIKLIKPMNYNNENSVPFELPNIIL